MALCGGLIVANLYYCQPLIVLIARDFRIDTSTAGRLNYITQGGYAAGLLFLVPLGDLIERKKQILVTTSVTILALICAALAPSFFMLQLASFFLGFSTIIPQLILPLAAHLTAPEKRGRVLGMVMSGLLLGILLSRTISGIIGAYLGWRAIYWIAAGICTLLLALMSIRFPRSNPDFKGTYGKLMQSLGSLLPQPVLQEACMINALCYGAFGAFWATMVIYLSGAPFNYNSGQIGLFGLAGAVGALVAPIAGKLNDKGNPRNIILTGILVILLSFVVFYFFRTSLAGIIAGIILLDFGIQAAHVSNQTRVYALIPEARNRLNTLYMTATFIGTASGSATGLLLWRLGGWSYFCVGGGGFMVVALCIFGLYHRKISRVNTANA